MIFTRADERRDWVMSKIGQDLEYPLHSSKVEDDWFDEEEFTQRYDDLLRVAEMSSDEQEAEYFADTHLNLVKIGRKLKQTDSELWEEELNDFIDRYYETGKIEDLNFPPQDDEDFRFFSEAYEIFSSIANSPIPEEDREQVEDYLESFYYSDSI